MAADTTRQAFTGSCHCGTIKYAFYVTLPRDPVSAPEPSTWAEFTNAPKKSLIYKCNCTPCHKSGMLHIRSPQPTDDFILFSPLLGTEEASISLINYKCNQGILNWYACKSCGVRCFSQFGKSEIVELDVDTWLGKETKGLNTEVWRPKKGEFYEWNPGPNYGYLSVNALTLDQDQEGLNLIQWKNNNWISYLEWKESSGMMSSKQPFLGGTY